MVKIDYLYGANWSLWLDIKILLRTVPYVLQPPRPLERALGLASSSRSLRSAR